MTVCAPRIDYLATTRDGTLTIAGHVMHRAAFSIVTAAPLWTDPDMRMARLTIPGRGGRYPLPSLPDETKYPLRFMVDGAFDPAGVAYPDEAEGLRANLAWLRTNITGAVTAGDGQRLIQLSKPDASGVLAGRATPSLKMGARQGSLWLGVLTLDFAEPHLFA